MLKNNKGFSLVEVLVTVGLIGVLTAIAVPAYNKYKDGTNLMAMKADLGNGMKTFTAYDAVNDTFCASFNQVGFSVNSSSPVWKRNAFIGFGNINSSDCTQKLADSGNYENGVQYKSDNAGLTFGSKTECNAAMGTWDTGTSKCTGGSAFEYKGTDPSKCVLGADSFIMGATSESAGTIQSDGSGRMIQISDGGTIKEMTGMDCQ